MCKSSYEPVCALYFCSDMQAAAVLARFSRFSMHVSIHFSGMASSFTNFVFGLRGICDNWISCLEYLVEQNKEPVEDHKFGHFLSQGLRSFLRFLRMYRIWYKFSVISHAPQSCV